MNYTLTVQFPALQMHGAVLGPMHTLRTRSPLLSLHEQLTIESQIMIFITEM